MKSTINDLWYGNINASEQCAVNQLQMQKVLALMARHEAALCSGFTDQQKKVWEKYVDCAAEYYDLFSEAAFRSGFSLGVKLLAEAYMQRHTL